MADIELRDVTKIFPFVNTKGFFGKKKKEKFLEKQKKMPYITNEGVIVLQHINLKIKKGEFVVVLGESGSGKSTLLRIIAGLEKQTLGDVVSDGKVINTLPPEDRNVAMVFQNYSLYPHLNARDNIAYPLRIEHLTRDEINEKVNDMAELCGIEDVLNFMPSKLSGGQAQRVAISRALVREPELFLLDEPLSNLDNNTRTALRKELKRIHKTLKTTFIYVTHDQADALYLAERVIVLRNGKIEQDATLEELYNYPNNIYCAGFLGSPKINIYSDIEVKNHKCSLFGNEYFIKEVKNGKVSLGIRPVNIVRSVDGIKVEVDYSEQIESNVVVHAKCEDKEIVFVEKVNKDLSNLFMPGTRLTISFEKDMMHVFDENGERLKQSV